MKNRMTRSGERLAARLFALFVIGSLVAGPVPAQPASAQVARTLETLSLAPGQPEKHLSLQQPTGAAYEEAPWAAKLDAPGRMLLAHGMAASKRGGRAAGPVASPFATAADPSASPFSIAVDEHGRVTVDLLVQMTDAAEAGRLGRHGVQIRTRVGDIVAVRAHVDRLQALAEDPAVRFVEVSRNGRLLNDNGRTDIRADRVHQGIDLPRAYQGEGVVVGVIDSGIDFTHPDFSDEGGTRIRYLWDMGAATSTNPPTSVDPQYDWGREYTKSQIDTAPEAVEERDGNGGHGHGTHVTGTAAGGGRINSDLRGIAPKADIIFVKGVRDPDSNGGFSDVDVVAGCDYIFKRAAQLGKPAVINLSLGGNFGSLDGSSLYEQALSNLTGPGRIIVAAGGNEGFQFIHAGGTSQPGINNETILFAHTSDLVMANMWYAPGVLSRVAVGVYTFENNQLNYVGNTEPLDVGAIMGVDNQGNLAPVPLQANGKIYGYVAIDATTTTDPRNGDGNVFFHISSNNDPNVDVSQAIWTIISNGPTSGRIDLWSLQGEFLSRELGLPNTTEMPGDAERTIGQPATAKKVISVGSYVTKNSWEDVDGTGRQWQNPNEERDPEAPPTIPVIGQRSYFSSRGPTRDGRTAPMIAAPGELIFSALSSHLTEGQGYERFLVLKGGNYHGSQGTSMASPHVAGVVALLLQADPTLDFDRTAAILRETARVDSQTGAVPNNLFGAGRIDALAAVQRVAGAGGGAAVAAVDVQELSLEVRPDEQVTRNFVLQNTGSATLSYTITTTEPSDSPPVAGGKLSSFTTLDQLAQRRRLVPSTGAAPGRLPEGAHATSLSASPAPATHGNDVLFLDDGNDTPGDFLGFSDGTDFYWVNQFDLSSTAFQLERIQFYMRTESAPSNTVWIAVYDVEGNTLVSGTPQLDVSPAGKWFEVPLTTPIDFSAGQTFYLEIGATEGLSFPDPTGFYPAGVDPVGSIPNKSFYFDPDSDSYESLSEVPGYANAAFLIRAVGTLGGGAANQPPQARAVVSTDEAQVNEVISFDASQSSDPDGQIVSYLWNFGDGTTSSQVTTTHAYTRAGTFTVTLTVTDDKGATGQASGTITITDGAGNQAPTAVAQLSKTQVLVNEAITFDATGSSDADGQIVAYLWNFGDGATSSQAQTTHAYAQAGTFTVTLTVTDDQGATGQASSQVTVAAQPARLVVTPSTGTVPAGASETISVTMDAQGLAERTYQGQITISGNGGTLMIPVRVLVSATVAAEEPHELPARVALAQNYPNPFNPETLIRYELAGQGNVTLTLFDLSGRQVRVLDAGPRGAGVHEVLWNGRDAAGSLVASGLYMYRLDVTDGTGGPWASITRKMIFLK